MNRFSARLRRAFAWTLCALFFSIPIKSGRADAVIGDLTGDGLVTAADAAALCRALDADVFTRLSLLNSTDLTQNGILNSVDARVLLSISAGAIPDLAAFVERVSTGLCDERFYDRFCYTGVWKTDTDYQSENVSVSIRSVKEKSLAYYVADIYIQDLTSLRTALANDSETGKYQLVQDMAAANNAVVAINGDFFRARKDGPIVRNGVFLRSNITGRFDLGVITHDGVMATYDPKALKIGALTALHPYQVFVFGPRLIDGNGKAATKFHSAVTGKNPRTVIGYYEPGHYCFVQVDGRQAGYSGGLNMKDLALLMESLGCKEAYNLDGGQTSAMATSEGLVNQPFRGGRPLSDLVYIGEPLEGLEMK